MTLRAILGLLFAAAATISAAQAQRGTWLGWKWDEGAVRRYRFTQQLDQEISGFQEKQLSWTISYLVKQEVRSVAADTGVATVAHTYESGVIVATEKSQEGHTSSPTRPRPTRRRRPGTDSSPRTPHLSAKRWSLTWIGRARC
jgi:hypothetical protein